MDVAVVGGEVVDDPDVSAGRLLGITCFETIAFHAGEIVHGEEHLERLARSARTIGIGPEGGWEAVDEAIGTALDASDHTEGIVRVSLHATGEPVGLDLPSSQAEVQVLVTRPRYGDLDDGVSVVTTTVQAPAEGAWPAHVKAPCLPRFLAHREASARDAFEALMLDAEDRVVSGSRSNVFALVDGTVATPPSPPARAGVSRSRVIDTLGPDEVRVRPIPRPGLDEADEVWLTFTGPSVVPVIELDGEPVGSGRPGPVASKLRDRLA